MGEEGVGEGAVGGDFGGFCVTDVRRRVTVDGGCVNDIRRGGCVVTGIRFEVGVCAKDMLFMRGDVGCLYPGRNYVVNDIRGEIALSKTTSRPRKKRISPFSHGQSLFLKVEHMSQHGR